MRNVYFRVHITKKVPVGVVFESSLQSTRLIQQLKQNVYYVGARERLSTRA